MAAAALPSMSNRLESVINGQFSITSPSQLIDRK
jgi:hypothetical protein